MVGCKEICHRYKATRKGMGPERYSIGQKRCQRCEIFVDWEGLYCPYCGFKFRTRPRNARFKKRLRELMSSSSLHTESKREDGWKERRCNNDLLCLRHHSNLQNVKLQTPIHQQITVAKLWWLCSLFIQWWKIHMFWHKTGKEKSHQGTSRTRWDDKRGGA